MNEETKKLILGILAIVCIVFPVMKLVLEVKEYFHFDFWFYLGAVSFIFGVVVLGILGTKNEEELKT